MLVPTYKDSFIIVKKAKYPFSLFSAPFEENNQKLVRNEGINSILCIETEPIKIKTGKNNLLQPYLSSRHLLDDHNILNDAKNRAETTYLNIFLSLKSGSFGSKTIYTFFCKHYGTYKNVIFWRMSHVYVNPTGNC